MLDVSIRTLRNKLHEYNGTAPKSEEERELTAESSNDLGSRGNFRRVSVRLTNLPSGAASRR